jgi:hypothetical protein
VRIEQSKKRFTREEQTPKGVIALQILKIAFTTRQGEEIMMSTPLKNHHTPTTTPETEREISQNNTAVPK